MSRMFEELDYVLMLIGVIFLCWCYIFLLNIDVFEILFGEEYLMLSFFVVLEVVLVDLGVWVVNGIFLEVLVGGLGLGYMVKVVLVYEIVVSLMVVDFLELVICWY